MAAANPDSWQSAGSKLGEIVQRKFRFTNDTYKVFFTKIDSLVKDEGVQHLSFKGEDFELCVQNISFFVVELVDFFVRNRYISVPTKRVDFNRKGLGPRTINAMRQLKHVKISTAILKQFVKFLDDVLDSTDFFFRQINVGPPKRDRAPKDPNAEKPSRPKYRARLFKYIDRSFSEYFKNANKIRTKDFLSLKKYLSVIQLPETLVALASAGVYKLYTQDPVVIGNFILKNIFSQAPSPEISSPMEMQVQSIISFAPIPIIVVYSFYRAYKLRAGFRLEDDLEEKLYNLQNVDLTYDQKVRIEESFKELLASEENSSRITEDLKKRIESYLVENYTKTGKKEISAIIDKIKKNVSLLEKFKINRIEKGEEDELKKYSIMTTRVLERLLKNEGLTDEKMTEKVQLVKSYIKFENVDVDIRTRTTNLDLFLNKLDEAKYTRNANVKGTLIDFYQREKIKIQNRQLLNLLEKEKIDELLKP